MIVGMLLGTVLGAGVWLAVAGMRARRPSLREAMADLHRPRPTATATEAASVWRQRWSDLALTLTGVVAAPPSQRQDLAVLGRTRVEHATDKLTYAAFFFSLPVLTAAVLAVAGLSIPTGLVVVAALGGAVGGVVVPDQTLKREGARRRHEFRHALASYVDLVVAAMAGGTAAEGALTSAAAIGSGWSFEQIRIAIDLAGRDNRSPWETLGALAHDLGLQDLSELTSSLTLVGESGARVRSSLTAKARALREHELADAQTEAEEASERMSVPVVALMVGFLGLVGYPALARVLSI